MKHKHSYNRGTLALFTDVDIDILNLSDPDLTYSDEVVSPSKPAIKVWIESSFWYTDKGVYRLSKYWGDLGINWWFLDTWGDRSEQSLKEKLGFCRWDKFKDIDLKQVDYDDNLTFDIQQLLIYLLENEKSVNIYEPLIHGLKVYHKGAIVKNVKAMLEINITDKDINNYFDDYTDEYLKGHFPRVYIKFKSNFDISYHSGIYVNKSTLEVLRKLVFAKAQYLMSIY